MPQERVIFAILASWPHHDHVRAHDAHECVGTAAAAVLFFELGLCQTI